MPKATGKLIVCFKFKCELCGCCCKGVSNVNKHTNRTKHGIPSMTVYEQYARPKSRRSSMPMSDVNIPERPRTSHGRRITRHEPGTRQAGSTGTDPERPSTRRSHRSDAPPAEVPERPMTRHGRRESMPERPVTRHGRRSSQNVHDESENSGLSGRERSQSDSSHTMQDYREGSTSRIDILRLDDGPTEPIPTPPTSKSNMRMRPKSAKGRIRPKPAPRPSLDRDETPTPALIMSPPPQNIMSPTPQPQVITPMMHSSDSRPSSSLNKFNPLPSIGRKPSVDADIMELNHPRPSPRNINGKSAISSDPRIVPSNMQGSSKGKEEKKTERDSYDNLRSQLQRLKTQENLLSKDEAVEKPVPKPRGTQQQQQAPVTKSNGTKNKEPQNNNVIVSVEPEQEFHPLTRKLALPAEPHQNEEHFILAVKLPAGGRPQRRFRPDDTLETVMNFAELSAQLDFQGCELVCDVPSHLVFRNLKVAIQDSGLKNRTVLHVQIPDADEEE